MALIKCEHCGHPISDKAPFCPKCGYLRVSAISEENLKPQGRTLPPTSNAPLKTPKGLWAMGIIGLLILAGGIVWLVQGIHNHHEQYLAELEYQRLERLRIEEKQRVEEQRRLEAQLRLEAEQKRIEELRKDSIQQENMSLKAQIFVKSLNDEYNSFDFRDGWEEELIKRGFEKTSDELKIERNFEQEEGYVKTHEIIYTLHHKENALSVIIKKHHFEYYSSLNLMIDFPSSEELEKFVRSIEDLGFFQEGGYYVSYPFKPGLVFLKEGNTIRIFDIVA